MPVDNLLRKIDGNSALAGAVSGAAGGAIVSALTNKKSAKTLIKAGGLMAVGGLAYRAYQDYRASQSAHSRDRLLGRGTVEDLPESQFEEAIQPDIDGNNIVILAMIAAAQADGRLDELERERIWQKAVEQGLPAGQLENLAEQIENPPGLASLAVRANTMELKIEAYLASLLVMSTGEENESYLNELKEVLELPNGLALALRRQVRDSEEFAA